MLLRGLFIRAPTQKAVKKSGLKVNETEPNEQIAPEHNKRLTRVKELRIRQTKHTINLVPQ